MELTVGQRKSLREALISAFPKQPELELMIEDELEEDLNRITQGEANYELVVRSLVKWAEAQGRLSDLVVGASHQNPGNPTLRSVVGDFLAALLAFESDHFAIESLESLITAIQPIEDIELVITCCRQTWPELHIHRPKVEQDLGNPTLSLSIKWLLILRLWIKDYRFQPDGTPCILAFVHYLRHHPNCPETQRPTLDRLLTDLQTALNYTLSAPSDSAASGIQAQEIKVVQGYFLITVQIPITEEEGSDRVFIKGFLAIKIDGQESQSRLVPLQDLATPDPADVDGGEQRGITSTLKQLEQQFPQWVHQAEEQLSAECISLEQTYKLSQRPGYKLIIEFFLPYEYLTEAVDLWQVNRPVRRLKQMVAVGKKHQVVVRSTDRLESDELLNQLNLTWQLIESFLQKSPTAELLRAKLATLDNLDCCELDALIYQFKKCFLGLKLVCPVCDPQSQAHRETIFSAVLAAGVPIALWSRRHDLPNLTQELESFLVLEYLRNLELLLEQVYDRRGRALTADDLGQHLALLCDEPKRLGQLNQFLRSGRLSA
jgi:hypothetical protein